VKHQSSDDRDERLFRLYEELAQAQAADESIDEAQWAERFDVEVEDVVRIRGALGWLEPEELGEEAASPAPPELPEDYELLEELGRGGMGVVYRARQRSLDREVAVKVLAPGELVFGQALARFRREAKSLARLRHRHIVSIHDVGECGGHVYYSMDLIEGAPLSSCIAEGEMTVARSVKLVRQVASAVAYVHGHGLVHRDLKPANVLVAENDDAFVVDFGLARDLGGDGGLTATGHLIGTPAYMAPEQARGDAAAVGEAADVYAMGAILYECLTGRPPFEGLPLGELVHAVIHREPPRPRKLKPSVPSELEWVVLRAMAKEADERYPTARALLEDLERFEEGRTVRAEPPGLARRLRLLARRERKVLVAALATLVCAALVFQFLLRPRLGPPREELLPAILALEADGKAEDAQALLARLVEREVDLPLDDWSAVLRARLRFAGEAATAGVESAAAEARARVAAACRERRPTLPKKSREPERLLVSILEARALSGPDDAEARREIVAQIARAARWATFSGQGEQLTLLAAELFPEAVGPRAAGTSARALWWALLDDFATQPPLIAWLVEDPARAEALALELVRSAGELEEDQLRLLPRGRSRLPWTELMAEVRVGHLVSDLVNLAGQNRSDVVGDAATDLACLLMDVPWSSDGWGIDVSRNRVLGHLQGLLGGTPIDAHRDRVSFVIEELIGDSYRVRDPLAGWLADHTGVELGEVSAQDWRDWWAEAREDFHPGLALKASLGLEEAVRAGDHEALLESFHRGLHRRRHHLLFDLVDNASGPRPRWPSNAWIADEPKNLANAWHERWTGRSCPPMQVRLAVLEEDGLHAPGELVWSTTVPVDKAGRAGYRFIQQVAPFYVRPLVDQRRLLNGRPLATEVVEEVEMRLDLQVRWVPGSLRLEPVSATIDPPVSGMYQQRIPHADRGAGVGRPLGVLWMHGGVGSFGDQPRSVVVLAMLEPATDAAPSYGEEEWREAIAAAWGEGGALLDAANGRSARRKAAPSLEHLLWLATHWPIPEAEETLRRVSELHLERALLASVGTDLLGPARLMIDDGAALEQGGLWKTPEKSHGGVGPTFWSERWLQSPVEEIREHAALHGKEDLSYASREQRARFAEELRAHGRTVPANLAWASQKEAGEARQMVALWIIGAVFVSIFALVFVLGVRSAVRAGHISLDPRRIPGLLSRGHPATVALLVVLLCVGQGAMRGWLGVEATRALVILAALCAWRSAVGLRTAGRFLAPFFISLAAILSFGSAEHPLAWGSLAFDLGVLSVFGLFERYVPPRGGAYRWLFVIAPFFAGGMLVAELLASLSLLLETCEGAAFVAAGTELATWMEGSPLFAVRSSNGILFLFIAWQGAHQGGSRAR